MRATLEPGEYLHVQYVMPPSGVLAVGIGSTDPVNAYILDQNAFRKYSRGQSFIPMAGGQHRSQHWLIANYVAHTHVHLIIENATDQIADFNYEVSDWYPPDGYA